MSESAICVENQHVFFRSSEDLSILEAGSVDFFVTSPPYWNLKDYGVQGEIGHEPYEDYIARMNSVWQECYRLATDDAVLVDAASWKELEIPAAIRTNRRHDATVEAMKQSGVDVLDIPAFLRKQAD